MPRVLVIGLDPYRVPGPWDPEPVASALRRASAAFAAAGIEATDCLVGLDGSDDVPQVVAAALGDGAYDVVLVGGGIRHDPDRLELFEEVVNLVHRLQPGAAIAFNRRPEDVVEAVQRRLELG
ncbi:hypothetical protein G5V58_11200 [Nocardioides anomalus]|uniref:Uncharacterized protein n=1 Tax=Nocardioides anomalus TaxID=2712223 RepID=A0A6G6WDL9_9ACTN|nr:hypothetical protein [Nocardioides anomalus]QIG43247.1 hypothetical protein G5V58_11200 [Nocardioides anomalus]